MKKIFGFVLGFLLLFAFEKDVKASCTQVASNQTTCTGVQTVTCSQNFPTPGKINRYCCDTQKDCEDTKAGVQEEIRQGLATPAANVDDYLCGDDGKGIKTAIGCIHVLGDQNAFLSDILKWATGVGSGIAFLLMLYAGFMIMTGSGNPERLKAGQELLTSAVAGLILLIFSVFILRFIGIDILGLDDFGFGK